MVSFEIAAYSLCLEPRTLGGRLLPFFILYFTMFLLCCQQIILNLLKQQAPSKFSKHVNKKRKQVTFYKENHSAKTNRFLC